MTVLDFDEQQGQPATIFFDPLRVPDLIIADTLTFRVFSDWPSKVEFVDTTVTIPGGWTGTVAELITEFSTDPLLVAAYTTDFIRGQISTRMKGSNWRVVGLTTVGGTTLDIVKKAATGITRFGPPTEQTGVFTFGLGDSSGHWFPYGFSIAQFVVPTGGVSNDPDIEFTEFGYSVILTSDRVHLYAYFDTTDEETETFKEWTGGGWIPVAVTGPFSQAPFRHDGHEHYPSYPQYEFENPSPVDVYTLTFSGRNVPAAPLSFALNNSSFTFDFTGDPNTLDPHPGAVERWSYIRATLPGSGATVANPLAFDLLGNNDGTYPATTDAVGWGVLSDGEAGIPIEVFSHVFLGHVTLRLKPLNIGTVLPATTFELLLRSKKFTVTAGVDTLADDTTLADFHKEITGISIDAAFTTTHRERTRIMSTIAADHINSTCPWASARVYLRKDLGNSIISDGVAVSGGVAGDWYAVVVTHIDPAKRIEVPVVGPDGWELDFSTPEPNVTSNSPLGTNQLSYGLAWTPDVA